VEQTQLKENRVPKEIPTKAVTQLSFILFCPCCRRLRPDGALQRERRSGSQRRQRRPELVRPARHHARRAAGGVSGRQSRTATSEIFEKMFKMCAKCEMFENSNVGIHLRSHEILADMSVQNSGC